MLQNTILIDSLSQNYKTYRYNKIRAVNSSHSKQKTVMKKAQRV